MSEHRRRRGELLSVASAVALAIVMFVLEWYGVDGEPGRFTSRQLASARDAWHGLTLLRWLMLFTIVVVLGAAIVHLRQRTHGAKTSTGLLITMLGTATFGTLVYRVLIDLPAPARVVDQKLGALLGIAFAFGIALGGWQSALAERELGHSARGGG